MNNTHRNKNALRLIENATQHLSGWDTRRGNYTETYIDKSTLISLVVEECIEVLSKNGNDYQALKSHFEMK